MAVSIVLSRFAGFRLDRVRWLFALLFLVGWAWVVWSLVTGTP
jgi:drug/metabolite transporter (DMT)-like permease